MLHLKNISKTYKTKYETVKALEDISLSFPQTGLFVILGPSGSGKSTLLKIICGLDNNYEGEASWESLKLNKLSDEKLASYRRNVVGVVDQEFNLYNNLTVEENVRLALDLLNKKDDSAVKAVLERLGIADLENKRITKISGGEKARTAIARAIVKSPKIIVADEPTGNLDAKTGSEVWSLLKMLSKESLVIVATHDLKALDYADKTMKIVDGKMESAYTESKEVNEVKLPKDRVNGSLVRYLASKIFTSPKKFLVICLFSMILSLTMLGISKAFTELDKAKIEAKAFITNNLKYVTLLKSNGMYFSEEDLALLEPYTRESKYYFGSNLTAGDEFFAFAFASDDSITDYYKYALKSAPDINLFVDFDELEFSYVGARADGPNEIMISNFLADYIIRLGVYDKDGNIFIPNSYEELLQKEIVVANVLLKISGIYLVDETIKAKDFISVEEGDLIFKYVYTYYIDKDFFEISNFATNPNMQVPNQRIANIYVEGQSESELTRLFKFASSDIIYSTDASEEINEITLAIDNINYIFKIVKYIFLVFSVVILIIYIHLNFKQNREKVSTFLSLGGSKKIIRKIYLLVYGIIYVLFVVVSLLLVLGLVWIFNEILSKDSVYLIQMLSYKSLTLEYLLIGLIVFGYVFSEYLKLKKLL